jgi:Zn-dependent protease with chaperone function
MRVINPSNYYHDQDKKTLEVLKAIPGFQQVVKSFMKIYNETMINGLNMSSKIRLGPNQLPDIYRLLPPICKVLGIVEPDFFLEMDPYPNAYTVGDSKISITVTSGLIKSMEEDELKAVLAHECGHIACRHCLYHSMADILLNKGIDLLGLDAISLPLKMAFYHWQRCSEFSADRAAAVYLQGSSSVIDIMIRLSGGSKEITAKVNQKLYIEQAKEYQQLIDTSIWNKTLQFLILMNQTHPFTAVRAAEIKKWCESGDFAMIMDYMKQIDTECHNCGGRVEEDWVFCKHCGNKI